jgi:hypothetical protein
MGVSYKGRQTEMAEVLQEEDEQTQQRSGDKNSTSYFSLKSELRNMNKTHSLKTTAARGAACQLAAGIAVQ